MYLLKLATKRVIFNILSIYSTQGFGRAGKKLVHVVHHQQAYQTTSSEISILPTFVENTVQDLISPITPKEKKKKRNFFYILVQLDMRIQNITLDFQFERVFIEKFQVFWKPKPSFFEKMTKAQESILHFLKGRWGQNINYLIPK